jgi:uncharacterized protein YndB with AHSA1/START domain
MSLQGDIDTIDSTFGYTTQNSKVIKASQDRLYLAFTNPEALAIWLAPGEMTGQVHKFDLKVGGGYQMSLFYPPSEKESRGKTTDKEDRYSAMFLVLVPNKRIVQAITFDSEDPAFSGEMTMEVILEAMDIGTKVTIMFSNIPLGISLKDNEAGTISSLDKLARFVE